MFVTDGSGQRVEMQMGPPKIENPGGGGSGGGSGGGGGTTDPPDTDPPDTDPPDNDPPDNDMPSGPGGGRPGTGDPYPRQGDERGEGTDPGRGEPDPGIDPGNPGSAPPEPDLKGVGSSNYRVSKGNEAMLISRVQNTGAESGEVTVTWTVGGQQVGSETATVAARSTRRFEATVTWSDLQAMGHVGKGNGGTIRARLDGGSNWDAQSANAPKLRATPPEDDSDDDDDGASWAVLPPVGSLTSKQTTAGAALALVVLLGGVS